MYANVEDHPLPSQGLTCVCLVGGTRRAWNAFIACGGRTAGCQARFRTGKEFPTPNIPGSLAVGRIHICPGQSRMESFFFSFKDNFKFLERLNLM